MHVRRGCPTSIISPADELCVNGHERVDAQTREMIDTIVGMRERKRHAPPLAVVVEVRSGTFAWRRTRRELRLAIFLSSLSLLQSVSGLHGINPTPAAN